MQTLDVMHCLLWTVPPFFYIFFAAVKQAEMLRMLIYAQCGKVMEMQLPGTKVLFKVI